MFEIAAKVEKKRFKKIVLLTFIIGIADEKTLNNFDREKPCTEYSDRNLGTKHVKSI